MLLRNKDQVPKYVVNMVMDVIPSLISSSYSDMKEREKIN